MSSPSNHMAHSFLHEADPGNAQSTDPLQPGPHQPAHAWGSQGNNAAAQPLTAILGGKAHQPSSNRQPLPNERQLLDQVGRGDEKAFAALVAHYWRNIYGQALTYMKSTHQAQDIVQEVFVKVWEKRQQLPAIERFDAFLFIIARNHLISALRKKIARPLDHDMAAQLPATTYAPDDQLAYKQLQQQLATAVNDLPARQRTAYLLSRDKGLSFEAIAQQMGLSKETVKKHICRALQSIRSQVRRHNDLLLLLPLLYALLLPGLK